MSPSTYVNVLCPTYGRPRQLEESISCFLRQTHENCHMYVLNDRVGQNLVLNHPRVTILNHAPRYGSLGEKRNALVDLAPPGLFMCWDDDDLYLPNHIAYSLENHKRWKTQASKHFTVWIDSGHALYRISPAAWMHTSLIHSDILHEIGGYEPIDINEDVRVVHKMLDAGHFHGPANWDLVPPTCIYRNGNPAHHMSDFAPDKVQASMDDHADRQDGDIQLIPHWNEDYVAKAAASWEAVCQCQ